MKKQGILAMAMAVCLVLSACSGGGETASPSESPLTQGDVEEAESEEATADGNSPTVGDAVVIVCSDEGVMVDGAAIGSDNSAAVYLAEVVESHPDVSAELANVANKVITITQPGRYSFSGSLTDGQIKVDVDPAMTENTIVELNNLTLECRTSPAILVTSAYDPQQAGSSSVYIRQAAGSVNQLTGSHIAEYTDDEGVEQDYDGAISSKVSITLDGEGALTLTADREGIESQMHLTIDSGEYTINSHDDCLNGSEDELSVITINGGWLLADANGGEEGDAIDSNGSVVINGGTVIAMANENSQDSGLDSDLGITINGGMVVAAGNMYDEVLSGGAQGFLVMNFGQPLSAGSPLVVMNEEGEPLLAYTPSYSYAIYVVSAPGLETGGNYTVYTGGTITGSETGGLYSQVDSYEGGAEAEYSGAGGFGGPGGGFGGGRGQRPNMENADGEMPTPPEGMEMPEDGEMPERPEGMEMPEGRERPEGGGGRGGGQPAAAADSVAEGEA